MTYTEPLLPVFMLICFAGMVLLRRNVRRAQALLWLGLAGLLLTSWPPAAWLFARPLESSYPIGVPLSAGTEAMVVLSGNVNPPAVERLPIPIPDHGTYARCRYAAWLYRNVRAQPVLVSGGVMPKAIEPFAVSMAHVLEAEGVPQNDIWIEGRSTNTYQNALFSAAFLKQRGVRRILLVMEADEVLRGELCFGKQGIAVQPAAFRHTGPPAHFSDLLPSWDAVRKNERALHEYGGLLWYKMLGRI